eukprot:tig00000139_g8302.t1
MRRPSGCGKSTLLSVLCRSVPLLHGALFAGAERVSDASEPIHTWRRKIDIDIAPPQLAVVSQSPHIFADTVLANIRVGNALATEEDVIEAAKAVHMHQTILGLPQSAAEAEEAHATVGQLRALPLFDEHGAALPDSAFDGLLAHSLIVTVERGSFVVEEGEPCGTVYFVLSGSASSLRRRR